MKWWQQLLARMRSVFRKAELDTDMDAEMRLHIELQTQENIEAGMRPEAARFAALRQFGWVDSIKETCRDQHGGKWIEGFLQDLHFGIRMLHSNPGFAAVAAITLALGIGANTAIFSVINAVLLKPLAYNEPKRLVTVWEDWTGEGRGRNWVSGGAFTDWKNNSTAFESLGLTAAVDMNLSGGDQPVLVHGLQVSATYLDVFRIRPFLGRSFQPGDDTPGGENQVLILSHHLWQERFGGNRSLIGQTVRLNQQTYSVIGVLPPKALVSQRIDFLVPLVFGTEAWHLSRSDLRFKVVGRLRPETTPEQTRGQLNSVKAQLQPLYPKWKEKWGVSVVPLQEELTGEAKPSLLLLLGSVGMVLLIACGNVANLFLAKAAARSREIAVRFALGATRRRILRQLLTESMALALLGGLLGVGLAFGAVEFLSRLNETTLPRAGEVTIDMRVLVFSLVTSLGSGAAFGLLPGLQLSSPNLMQNFKESGRVVVRSRFPSSAVVAEVALSLVLLVGTGLLLKSFSALLKVPLGFNPQGVLAMDLLLPETKYKTGQDRTLFLEKCMKQLEAIPGIQTTAWTTSLPLEGLSHGSSLFVEGRENQPDSGYSTHYDLVGGDYFRAMGIALQAGRTFSPQDNSTNSPPVAIVNQQLAKTVFPGEDPIGRRIRFWDQTWEVVGVVASVRQQGLEARPDERLYLPQVYCLWGNGCLLAKADRSASMLEARIRLAIRAMDAEQPVARLRSLPQIVALSLAGRRFTLTLVAAFGLAALGLALIGLYGVMSCVVAQRTREIGLRMALGANPFQVLTLVIQKGLLLVFLGVVIGTAGSLALSQVLATQLFQVSRNDPAVLITIGLTIFLVATLASWIPARRAAKVDPMVALRYE